MYYCIAGNFWGRKVLWNKPAVLTTHTVVTVSMYTVKLILFKPYWRWFSKIYFFSNAAITGSRSSSQSSQSHNQSRSRGTTSTQSAQRSSSRGRGSSSQHGPDWHRSNWEHRPTGGGGSDGEGGGSYRGGTRGGGYGVGRGGRPGGNTVAGKHMSHTHSPNAPLCNTVSFIPHAGSGYSFAGSTSASR